MTTGLPSPRHAGRGTALLAAGLAFLSSGAAGLVYQVAWQRILALHSGVGIYSIAMIVAAFMAGLGTGSHLGGVLSLRLDAARAARAFALVEVMIGLFGAVSPWLFYDVLYHRAGSLYASPLGAGVMHFAALFLPTCLMGMSLPLLVRGMVHDTSSAGRTVAVLYGINLLGASLGALLAPWVLIRHLGIPGAVQVAAMANLTAGLLGLVLLRLQPSETGAPAAAPRGATTVEHPFALWVALYAASGFVALSLEIVWFRMLELSVKATAFTFGTMLCLYLAGSALGCLLGAPLLARLRHPLRAFLLCQCVLLAYAGLTLLLLARLPPGTPGYAWFFEYWSSSLGFKLGEAWEAGTLLRLYLLFPLVLYGPPTLLMGLSFPILQRAVHDDPRTSGRKVGLLQAANIAGCVLGSLLIGLLGLRFLGSTGSLRLLLLVGAGFAVVGFRVGSRRVFAGLGVALALLAVALPGQRDFWLRLHGTASPVALVEEDATGIAALVPDAKGPWRVYVNGKHHSWIPFGGMHTRLGAAPAMVHPAPVDVAIIGLGSGDTAWAAGARPETRAITVFEISAPQPRLLAQFSERNDVPALRRFLADPRVRILAADGRRALAQGEALYDLIEADALWPEVAYSGNLYSVEFFQQCARRLKPGGIMCTWAPTPRIYASFSRAFPHMLGTASRDVLIGSASPLPLEPEVWHARLASSGVVSHLGPEHALEAGKLLNKLIPLNRRGFRHHTLDTNHDLYPRDEFLTP